MRLHTEEDPDENADETTYQGMQSSKELLVSDIPMQVIEHQPLNRTAIATRAHPPPCPPVQPWHHPLPIGWLPLPAAAPDIFKRNHQWQREPG